MSLEEATADLHKMTITDAFDYRPPPRELRVQMRAKETAKRSKIMEKHHVACRDRAVALAMVTHRRLGAASPGRVLPYRMIGYIWSFVRHTYLPNLPDAEEMTNKEIMSLLKAAKVLTRHLPSKTKRREILDILSKHNSSRGSTANSSATDRTRRGEDRQVASRRAKKETPRNFCPICG